MLYYINNFLLFSILGYFFESTMYALLHAHNQSGFLHLFWTPFYGIGVIVTIVLDKFVKNLNIKGWQKIFLLSILLLVVLSLLELTGGIMSEKLFGYSLWSYNNVPFHLGKYISLPTSIGWVLFSFIYLMLKKYTDKLVVKVPKFISISLLIIFLIDNVITIYQILYFRDFL